MAIPINKAKIPPQKKSVNLGCKVYSLILMVEQRLLKFLILCNIFLLYFHLKF